MTKIQSRLTGPTDEHRREDSKFGDLLREYRKRRGFTLGAFAGILGMPATNLSDIELGRRQPLRVDQIERAARVLELADEQIDELVATAAEGRGAIELPLDGRKDAAEVSAALAREWPTMTTDDLQKLSAFMRDLVSKKVK